MSSHEYNSIQGLHQSEDDAGELNSTVKSEREDWTEDDDHRESYSIEDDVPPEDGKLLFVHLLEISLFKEPSFIYIVCVLESGLDTSMKPDAKPGRYFPSNGGVGVSQIPNDFSKANIHHRSHKSKINLYFIS